VLVLISAYWLWTSAAHHEIHAHGWVHGYGFDFHGGIWKAGQDVLHGRSPYEAPNAQHLAAVGNAYIPPPLLAEVFVPLSVLPFGVAVLLLNALCVCAFVAALRLLGVRDPELYVIGLCSAPFIFALSYGDPDGIFVLLAALAWHYRDSMRGAVAVGSLIAAKLLLWPLVIWLIVTRRVRQAALAIVTAAGLLVLAWALIGFKGLLHYPQLLAADSKVQATNHSVAAALRSAGLSPTAAYAVAVIAAVLVALAVVRASHWSDRGWFTGAVIAGLIASPVVFPNYFLILFVPLAIGRPTSRSVWLLTAAFWLSPRPTMGLEWVLAGAIAIWSMNARQKDQTQGAAPTRVDGPSPLDRPALTGVTHR
jgi:hypothetical protein